MNTEQNKQTAYSRLLKQVKKSQEAISKCPEWVRKSMVWQGGGEIRR